MRLFKNSFKKKKNKKANQDNDTHTVDITVSSTTASSTDASLIDGNHLSSHSGDSGDSGGAIGIGSIGSRIQSSSLSSSSSSGARPQVEGKSGKKGEKNVKSGSAAGVNSAPVTNTGGSAIAIGSGSLSPDVSSSAIASGNGYNDNTSGASGGKTVSGFLTVHLKRARRLRAADINGFSDPYVILELSEPDRKQQHQSDVVKKTLNPVWDELFCFNVGDRSEARLHLTVMDWDRFTAHDYLGVASCSVKLLEAFVETDLSMALDTIGIVDLVVTFIPSTVYGQLVRGLIEKHTLYRDVDFPPEERSIGDTRFVRRLKLKKGWMRTSEVCEKNRLPAHLFLAGIEPSDIQQQRLGDCYFLCAVAVAASQPALIRRMFQPQHSSTYGIYQVKFFFKGKWNEVIIDDYLPMMTIKDPAFARSASLNELWVSLCEKAYAKMHGSYEAIEGAHSVREAFEHVTGGYADTIHLETVKNSQQDQDKLFEQMLEWRKYRYLMACSTAADEEMDFEPGVPNENGIIAKHAYSLLDVQLIDGYRLLKCRNTWGREEWKGRFSDGDREHWTEELKERLHFRDKDDGVFWMSFDDFLQEFRHVYVCKIVPDGFHQSSIHSQWNPDKGTSGGMIMHSDTFLTNPQFQLLVPHDSRATSVRCCITIEREMIPDKNDNPIGLYVFRNDPSNRRMLTLPPSDADEHHRLVVSSNMNKHHRDMIDVVIDKAAKNPYVIIPAMWYPGRADNFKITVHSEHPVVFRQIPADEDWHTTILEGSFDTEHQYGPHTQVTTFPTNPMFLIDNLVQDRGAETMCHITVSMGDKTTPFYPYLLRQSGIDKLKTKRKMVTSRDCCLFPPRNTFYQGTFTFKCTLRKHTEGTQDQYQHQHRYALVLATLYPLAESAVPFTVTIRTSNRIKVSSLSF